MTNSTISESVKLQGRSESSSTMNTSIYRRRRLVNAFNMGASTLTMAFGLFWLLWILFTLLQHGLSDGGRRLEGGELAGTLAEAQHLAAQAHGAAGDQQVTVSPPLLAVQARRQIGDHPMHGLIEQGLELVQAAHQDAELALLSRG